MLYQYIKDKGFQQGMQQGELNLLSMLIAKKFNIPPESLMPKIKKLSHETFAELSEKFLFWDSYDQVRDWIEMQQRKAKENNK
jgi:hypothetical protein